MPAANACCRKSHKSIISFVIVLFVLADVTNQLFCDTSNELLILSYVQQRGFNQTKIYSIMLTR